MSNLDIINKLKELGIDLIDANLGYPYDDANSYIFDEDGQVTSLEINNIDLNSYSLDLIFQLESLIYLTLTYCKIQKISNKISNLTFLLNFRT